MIFIEVITLVFPVPSKTCEVSTGDQLIDDHPHDRLEDPISFYSLSRAVDDA